MRPARHRNERCKRKKNCNNKDYYFLADGLASKTTTMVGEGEGAQAIFN